MANPIKFIPSQMDALGGTTTEACRENPIRLFFQDLRVLATMLPYLPWVILPFKTTDQNAELYQSVKGLRDTFLQGWLFFLENLLLLFIIPAYLILPGALFLFALSICFLSIFIAAWPMQGSRILYSKMGKNTTLSAQSHESERWIFVNGIITSHDGLQKNIDRISVTFGRAVIGIHNRSYGFFGDIIECLIQRCLSYNTMDVRIAYDYVKACLSDPTVNKVVLIGHSQGGIIVSQVLDHLYSNVPLNTVSKLEVYTFGSAASHFNNPRFSISSPSSRSIAHIEHYCNEHDMIPRWGVLYNTMTVLDNSYSGTVFVRMGASGHLFNQHYMDPMFPLQPTPTTPSHHQQQHAIPNGHPDIPHPFLDKEVDVDEKTAVKRERTALRNMGLMRAESSIDFGNGDTVPVGVLANSGADGGLHIGFIRPGDDAVVGLGREARGKTVRELSRLWMYMGGASPGDQVNGVAGNEMN